MVDPTVNHLIVTNRQSPMCPARRGLAGAKIQTVVFSRDLQVLTEKYSQLTKVTGVVIPVDFAALSNCPSTYTIPDWIIVNCVDFLNRIETICRASSLFCTVVTCPMFNAGPKYQYFWEDADTAPVQMSAPDYFSTLKRWIKRALSNRKLFPREPGIPFSPEARETIETAYRRLFRVFAHLYTCHFAVLQKQGFEKTVNTLLTHFIVFSLNYSLIPEEELEMLEPVFRSIGEGPSS
jgi:MOB kinase activator 1